MPRNRKYDYQPGDTKECEECGAVFVLEDSPGAKAVWPSRRFCRRKCQRRQQDRVKNTRKREARNARRQERRQLEREKGKSITVTPPERFDPPPRVPGGVKAQLRYAITLHPDLGTFLVDPHSGSGADLGGTAYRGSIK